MSAINPAMLGQRLEHALRAVLKPDVAKLGSRLLARLDGPVHIAIIGPAGTGKTRLRDMLERQRDLPNCVYSELSTARDGVDLSLSAQQVDIVVWCGQVFGAADLDLWSKVPESLKDHSFAVLTKADNLAALGQLHSSLAALGDAIAEEFLGVFPVATLQALAASDPQMTNSGPAFRASGAAALTSAILQQITQARDAARDSALVFLDRHGTTAQAAIVSDGLPGAPTKADRVTAPDMWLPCFAYLTERAQDLCHAQDLPAADKIRLALDSCCETTDGLINLVFGQSTSTQSEALLVEEIMAASDAMVLMRLEGGADSAIDAMALLLQLRRDIAMSTTS